MILALHDSEGQYFASANIAGAQKKRQYCLQQTGVCCSVWTVDLAHLLSNHGCLVTFLTVTVGANPEYASERFYARNIHSDKFRVERLFQQAQQAGISISVRSVDWQELRGWLTGGTGHLIL